MTRAVVYGRVSMYKQKESGAGEAAQEDDCSDFVRRMGYELVGPYLEDEAVSGKKSLRQRPALRVAIDALEPGDVLVVAKRDRLARSVSLICTIEEAVARRKCRILSAAGEGTEDDSPSSVLMRRMIDAFAEFECANTATRTKRAAAAKRKRGMVVGQVPYGWRLDPDSPINPRTGKPTGLVHDQAEQFTLELIHRRREEGMPLRKIAEELEQLGVRPRKGLQWSHSSISSILKTAPNWTPQHDKEVALETDQITPDHRPDPGSDP